MNNGYVQVPCARCGTTVWIAPQAGVGYCPSCQAPNQLPGAAPGAAPGYGPPQAFAMPTRAGLPIARLMAVALGVVVAIGAGAASFFLRGHGKGMASYGSLHISPDKADPDLCITAVSGLATKWKKDAGWWSANFNYVGPDGLMDLSKGGVQVTYISPSRVASAAKSVRKDSVKEFAFGPSGVNYKRLVGAKDPWKGVVMPPLPKCGIKQLAASLASKGLVAGKLVHISFDPKFAGMVDGQSWHVMGTDPQIDAWYSMVDCHQTK